MAEEPSASAVSVPHTPCHVGPTTWLPSSEWQAKQPFVSATSRPARARALYAFGVMPACICAQVGCEASQASKSSRVSISTQPRIV